MAMFLRVMAITPGPFRPYPYMTRGWRLRTLRAPRFRVVLHVVVLFLYVVGAFMVLLGVSLHTGEQ